MGQIDARVKRLDRGHVANAVSATAMSTVIGGAGKVEMFS